MHVSLCGVNVNIVNAIERYVSCVMVVRVGPRSMAVDGCMLVPVCIVYLCFGYVCMNVWYDVVCIVYWCAYVHAYVRICMWCEHICVCLYVCGGADVAWMMGLESWWCRAAGST